MKLPVENDSSIPRHVAIIMDGNGRWAEKRGLPRFAGHVAGVDSAQRVIDIFVGYRVEYLTLYVFSTENWGRPRDEVNGLLKLMVERIDSEIEFLCKKSIKFRHLGNLSRLPWELRQKINRAMEISSDNTKMVLSIAIDYGGRAEIIESVQHLVAEGISVEDINEATFGKYLSTVGMPDPDLIIRTGGEMRLSNFLLWQAAYSELYFTSTLWPDFGKEEIAKALQAYAQRHRRFGATT